MTTTNQTEIQSDDGLAEQLEPAGNRFVEIKNDMAKHLATRAGSLGAWVREHPFAAAGVGLGIGYLVARLLHR
jgi:ElaB/YqjD/DUF883 family membrane-anchored ribosome-binding protein